MILGIKKIKDLKRKPLATAREFPFFVSIILGVVNLFFLEISFLIIKRIERIISLILAKDVSLHALFRDLPLPERPGRLRFSSITTLAAKHRFLLHFFFMRGKE